MQALQDLARDVLAGPGLDHDEAPAVRQHVGQIAQRHVGQGLGVVEAAAAIPLDQNFWMLCDHVRQSRLLIPMAAKDNSLSPSPWARAGVPTTPLRRGVPLRLAPSG